MQETCPPPHPTVLPFSRMDQLSNSRSSYAGALTAMTVKSGQCVGRRLGLAIAAKQVAPLATSLPHLAC